MRQFLIGAQVAGSCVLLIVAGLLVRALGHAVSTRPGFEFEQVVSIDPGLGAHGYSNGDARAYLATLKSRLVGLPGIESVSMASTPPLGRKTTTIGLTIDGKEIAIHSNNVDPEFFHTMKIPLLRGRALLAGDTQSIVISDSLARLAWPGKDALGGQFDAGDGKYTVVGIAGNARFVAPEDADAVEAYFPVKDDDLPSMVVLVKASGPPEGLVPFLSSTAKSIDPKMFPEVQLMKSSFRRRLKGTQYSALAVSVLGSVALLLACLGIVGLVAYGVSQRTKEIGLRMALGAQPADVLAVVLRQFSRPVVIGLLVGIGGAAALSQVVRRQLYGISNLDPLTYVVAIAVFVAAVAVAALIPARRALRVDPLKTLRYE
jgi:predicted permease